MIRSFSAVRRSTSRCRSAISSSRSSLPTMERWKRMYFRMASTSRKISPAHTANTSRNARMEKIQSNTPKLGASSTQILK